MRTWKLILLGFAVLLIGGCIAISISNGLLYSQCAFDSNSWRAGDVRQRARMVVDLQSSGVLLGKYREEVSTLLGQPDSTGPTYWTYDYADGGILGDAFDLPFSGWHEWVYIEFDETTGQVHKIELQD